jgi:hypothetical protein
VLAAVEARRPPGRMGYPTVYVRWRGALSDAGQYGHMGLYARQFSPAAVLDVRPAAPRDCP